MKTYKEKLQDLLLDKNAIPIEWRQSNKQVGGYIESEVVFKFKKSLSEKAQDFSTCKNNVRKGPDDE